MAAMLAAELEHHAACAVHNREGWPEGARGCKHCSYRAALNVYRGACEMAGRTP
jgi:hypothetical protein